MIFVPLVALLVATAAGIVEVQETSTAKNMKEEKEDGNAVARENYSSRSAAAVLMMVFQFAKDNTAIHRQGRTDGDREML